MPRPSLLVLTALALLAGCASLTEPRGQGDLRVSAAPPNLVLSNPGDRAVYYFAIEQDLAARALWGPCSDPDRCPRVLPGRSASLPYDSVAGYEPGVETALVYWWHLVPRSGGGFEPDSIRVRAVRF